MEPKYCPEHMEVIRRAENMDARLHALGATRDFLKSEAVEHDPCLLFGRGPHFYIFLNGPGLRITLAQHPKPAGGPGPSGPALWDSCIITAPLAFR